MKWIIGIFLMFSGFLTQAQDGYVFTKQQHDEIRKNLQDYKRLIGQFDSLGREFKIMKTNYEFYKALHDKDVIKLQEFDVAMKNCEIDKKEYNDLLFQNSKQKDRIDRLEAEVLGLTNQTKKQNITITHLRTRNARLIDKTRGDRIIEGTVFGMLVGCSILGIWSEIQDHLLHHHP